MAIHFRRKTTNNLVGIAITENCAVIVRDMTSAPIKIEIDSENLWEKITDQCRAMKLYKAKIVLGLSDTMIRHLPNQQFLDITEMKKKEQLKFQKAIRKEIAQKAGFNLETYQLSFKCLKTESIQGKMAVSSVFCPNSIIDQIVKEFERFDVIGIDANIESFRRTLDNPLDYIILRVYDKGDINYLDIAMYRGDFMLGYRRELAIDSMSESQIHLEINRTIGALTSFQFNPETCYLINLKETLASRILPHLDFEKIEEVNEESYLEKLAQGLILWGNEHEI